ncbi:MAG: ABC transporter ATP-binding protein [Clostridia bacterium]|nr:ABC transporter ATP-binding protein [Clostridia bacterium]
MIFVNGVDKSFGKAKVLDNISFNVNDCSVYGLIGYNGAGKTTLLNILSGLYLADNGKVEIEIDGKKQQPFDNPAVKRSLFYVNDDPYYFPNANLITMRDFYCGMYPNWSDESFKKLIHLFGIDPNKKMGNFSKGMKRQGAIILGLASKARYIFLDESFDGLDPNIRTLVSNLLAEYIAETEGSIIAASHNLYELEGICDTVGMINGNKMLYSDDIDVVKSKARKYRVSVKGNVGDEITTLLNLKFLKNELGIITFQSNEEEEKIKTVLSKYGEIVLFESFGMTLNEIFVYETEDKGNEIEGIFA